jgi:hypothetical protein
MMRKILAAMAILGLSSTAALACPMSGGHSASVDRELVVASLASEAQEVDAPQMTLIEQTEDEAAE